MKKIVFLLGMLLIIGGSFTSLSAEVAFDFDGSNTLDDKDLAIMIGWKQLVNAGVPSASITTTVVLGVAQKILASVSSVSRLPDTAKDNLSTEGTAALDDQDLAYFISYNQLKNAGVTTFTFSSIETVASKLITLTTGLGKLPGTAIGDSTFSTTITGITADP